MRETFRLFSLTVAIILLAGGTAKSAIVKTAKIDCQKSQICFYWWPKLPALPGWHTDTQANYSYGPNGMYSLVPDKSDFNSADVIIYASATYKPQYGFKNSTSKTLDAFIADEQRTFRKDYRNGLRVGEVKSLVTGDGRSLRSLTYFRPRDKNWERVSYGEEGDYYLIFAISARSEKGYLAAQPTYENLIKAYKQ
jgi:hypothetical protein